MTASSTETKLVNAPARRKSMHSLVPAVSKVDLICKVRDTYMGGRVTSVMTEVAIAREDKSPVLLYKLSRCAYRPSTTIAHKVTQPNVARRIKVRPLPIFAGGDSFKVVHK